MNKNELKYLFIIMVIFIAACIETDIYLPAFSDMMTYFSTGEEEIHKLLTWNFIGLCLSGPIYGPLSDSFGRKNPLLVALGLFLAGSIITIFASDFSFMLWGRLLQGLGSGGCFTLGTAIIFDVFQEKKAVDALNKMNSIVPFLLASAPLLGGYLNYAYGFRSNFLTIALCVGLSWVICVFHFEETLPVNKRSFLKLSKIIHDFKRVGTSLPFWQLTLVISLLFAGFLAFLAQSAVLFVVELGVAKQAFPFYQAAPLVAYLIASLTCSQAIEQWGLRKIKSLGATLIAISLTGFVIAAWLAPRNPVWLTCAMLPYAFGFIWTQSPYVGELMALVPEIRGVAASVLTSVRLLLGAVLIGLVGDFYNATIYPVVMLLLAVGGVVLPIIYCYEKKKCTVVLEEQNLNL